MHSFRLRYIVLGLLIYIQSAFCRTCGSDFHDDLTSRAVLANVVVEGRMRRAGLNDASGHYNVTFHVGKRYKGDITPSNGEQRRSILVGPFGPEDRRKCIIPVEIKSQEQYILFLNATSDPRYFRPAGFLELASKKSKKEVRKGTCRKCAKMPKARASPSHNEVEVGKRIQVRCKASGKPSPRVRWLKDGVPINKHDRNYQIKDTRRGTRSRLRVRKAKARDSGTYTCEAASVVGIVTSNAQVTVHTVGGPTIISNRGFRTSRGPIMPPQEVFKPISASSKQREKLGETVTPHHANKCEKQTFCLNGGTCFELKIDGPSSDQKYNNERKFCKCSKGYTGPRCQDKDITSILTELESRELHHLDRTLTISGLVICALVLVGILILSWYLARRKKKKFLKRKELKEKHQQEKLQIQQEAAKKPLIEEPAPKSALELFPPMPTPPSVVTDDNSTQTDVPYPTEVEAMVNQVYAQPPPLPNHHPSRHPNHHEHPQHPHPHHYNPHQHPQHPQHQHQHRPPPPQHDPHRRNSNPGMRDPNHRNSHHREYPHRDPRGDPREHGPYASGRREHHGHNHPEGMRREPGHHDPSRRDSGHHSTGPREHRHRDPKDPRYRNSGHGSLDSQHHHSPHPSHQRESYHRGNPQDASHGPNHQSLPRGHSTAPPGAGMDGPQRSGSGRMRLPASSATPDMNKSRRSSGGNIAVVSAVVESEPEQHSKRNPQLNSTPDPMLNPSEADFLLHQNLESQTAANQGGLPLDLDQQSDYDNQASDMEVNLESEADVHALDASGDEVEGHGQGLSSGQADSESSASSESDSTSSIDEERALFQQLTQNPRVNSRTNSRANSRTNSLSQLPDMEDPLSGWDEFASQSLFPQLGPKYNFTPRPADPYATDNDIIANKYFLDNSSKRKKNDDGQIREFPYDPDPDATVV